MKRDHAGRNPTRRGMTLLVVVVLVMLISLSAYRYTFVMESEYRLTRLQEELVQARLSALSGIEYAAHLLEKPTSERSIFAAPAARERIFRRTTLREDSPSDQRKDLPPAWQFGLISPEIETSNSKPSTASAATNDSLGNDEAIQWRWGVANESAKLSIPVMLRYETLRPGHFRSVLLDLPGMDEETTDAMLDQLGVPRANGTMRQTTDVSEVRAPIARIAPDPMRDRLRALWFGGDLNQNYRLDPIEAQLLGKLSRSDSGAASSRPGLTSDQRWQPLQRYLTWSSGERNERPNGSPRIYLNQANLQQLHQQLLAVYPLEFANFVIAYRQYGPNGGQRSSGASARPSISRGSSGLAAETPSSARPSASSSPSTANEIAISANEFVPTWTMPARFLIESPLDLVGAAITLPSEVSLSQAGGAGSVSSAPKPSRAPKKVLKSPFSSDIGERRNYLGMWLSDTTVIEASIQEGRVDISEAPVEVLRGVPGIDAALAQRIVDQRRNAASVPDAMNSIAWLLEAGIVDIQKLRELEPFLTTRSDVYSVQSIGFRDNRSPVYRCTVTIDARRIPASLLDLKVWHPWDRGFDIDSFNE